MLFKDGRVTEEGSRHTSAQVQMTTMALATGMLTIIQEYKANRGLLSLSCFVFHTLCVK